MSDLRELYQSLILDHGRRPRNFKELPNATNIKEGFNPLCGDRLTLFVESKNEQIMDIAFQGCGCAISMASSSLMTEAIKGKQVFEAKKIFKLFYDMIMQRNQEQQDFETLGKLTVLKGVAEFPARVKCATLAWHTLIAALENSSEPVTTE